MHCPGGNATDPIWRVLASSGGISSWTPLKPQHSNPDPNPLPNKLWCINFLTPPTQTPCLSSSLTDSLPSLNLLCHSKTDARFMQDAPKAVWSFPYVSVAVFPSLKQNFIAYRSPKVSSCPDYIFEIHQLWQSGFSRVYSNSCCSCSFEAEIIKIGLSSHKMYSNNILNFHESTTILNACTKKKSGNLLKAPRINNIFHFPCYTLILKNGHIREWFQNLQLKSIFCSQSRTWWYQIGRKYSDFDRRISFQKKEIPVLWVK